MALNEFWQGAVEGEELLKSLLHLPCEHSLGLVVNLVTFWQMDKT